MKKSIQKLFLFSLCVCSLQTWAQERNISGVVSDDKGLPLPGVNIQIKTTSIGTVTNFDGEFSLTVPDKNSVLVLTSVGFDQKELTVGSQSTFNITLQEDLQALSEVVVIGYGSENKRNLSSAVSSINGEAVENRPVVNFQESIRGKLPGVSISQSNGAPGAGMTMNIRGVGSITGGTEPLYVVDGVPLSSNSGDKFSQGNDNYNYSVSPLSSINPNSIKSVEVLKDAAATAIYGSRGSNGVVIITTKSGKYNKEPTININVYGGVSQLANKVDVMDAYEHANYTKLARDLSWINKDPGNHSASDPLDMRNIDDRYPSYMIPYINGKEGLTNTDWQDAFYRTAKVQNYDISATGGSEDINYFISANYLNQEGIIPNSGVEKVGLQVKLESQLTDKLKVRVNLNPTFTDNNLARSEKNWGSEGLVIGTLMYHPQLPVYNDNGSYAVDILYNQLESGESNVVQFQNPLALANQVENQMDQFRLNFNLDLEYDIFDKITYKTVFGGDINQNARKYYRPKGLSYRNEPAPTTYRNYGEVFNSSYRNLLWDNTITYSDKIKDHSWNIVLGTSYQREISKNSTLEGRNFATDNVTTINTSQERYGSESQRESSLSSYFGRASYDYLGKYLISGTIRADGSSKFGSNSKWGVFPSLSVGWRVSDEKFFQSELIDNLKIRSSYGLTGNNNIPYYGSIALLSTGGKYTIGDQVQTGLYPYTAPNPDLSWETTKTFDIGLNLTFAKNFTLTGDYYNSNTSDLLLQVPVPSSSGYDQTLQNMGELQNRGFELGLSSNNEVFGGQLRLNVNFSTNENKVLALGPGQDQIISSGGLSGSHVTRIGHPVGSFFGYKVLGKFENKEELNNTPKLGSQAVGDFIYQDTNADGVVDAEDRVILGNNQPDYQIGFNLNYAIKGFDFSASLYTKQGQEVINTMHRYLAEAWGNNLSVYLEDEAPRPVWGWL